MARVEQALPLVVCPVAPLAAGDDHKAGIVYQRQVLFEPGHGPVQDLKFNLFCAVPFIFAEIPVPPKAVIGIVGIVDRANIFALGKSLVISSAVRHHESQTGSGPLR